MKGINLGATERRRFTRNVPFIDKVPPKSCYKDSNRSDMIVSKSFKAPSDTVLSELRASCTRDNR